MEAIVFVVVCGFCFGFARALVECVGGVVAGGGGKKKMRAQKRGEVVPTRE